MQYNDTFANMVGMVRQVKPMAPPSLIQGFLNGRMRTVLNRRPFWAGLQLRKAISIPNAYATGRIALLNGSTVVNGTGVSWPYNDLVNTTIPSGNLKIGPQWFTPLSMQNIDDDSVLYVDDAGTSEIVPITKVDSERAYGTFRFAHNPNCTVWMSSFVHRQLRLAGGNPMYSIVAVQDANTLVLSQAWAGSDDASAAYSIVKAYLTIDSRIKQIEFASDSQQRMPIKVHVPQKRLMLTDPYRLATENPFWLVDHEKNVNGNMTFELYPTSTSARQIEVIYFIEWPKMEQPTDQAPPFINPTTLIYGAMSDVLGIKVDAKDEINLASAGKYEQMFESGVVDLMNADESKMMQAYDADWTGGDSFGGSDFWVNRDPSVFFGTY